MSNFFHLGVRTLLNNIKFETVGGQTERISLIDTQAPSLERPSAMERYIVYPVQKRPSAADKRPSEVDRVAQKKAHHQLLSEY